MCVCMHASVCVCLCLCLHLYVCVCGGGGYGGRKCMLNIYELRDACVLKFSQMNKMLILCSVLLVDMLNKIKKEIEQKKRCI